MILAITDAQYALAPAGEQATRIAHLWWIYFWVLSAIFVLVAIFLFLALLRRTHASEPIGTPPPEPRERRISGFVIGCVIATVVILFALLITDFFSGRAIYALGETDLHPENGDELEIKIIGHQWWWEVVYPNPQADQTVTTANEIHVPVNTPVVILTNSSDVIHSFWAPSITGKRDLLPGYSSAFWFKIEQPGTYRGQCAEFCGLQHAHMGFSVIAQSVEDFQSWEQQQLKPAAEPSDDETSRGRAVFLTHACLMCHTIRGTDAGSRFGPDLTHIASRNMIAAETLPNTRGAMAGWILDPQRIKPGTEMSPNSLAPDDLQALLAYLQTLQ